MPAKGIGFFYSHCAPVCVLTDRPSVIDHRFMQTRTNAVVAFDFFVLVLLITLNSA